MQVNVSSDIANGLNLDASIEYSDNRTLVNNSTYSIIDRKNREIQPNIPINNKLQPRQLDNHQSFIGRVVLEYTPRHRYRIRNHTKVYAESKYPTFSLAYNRAFADIFGSDARFDVMKLGIRQKRDIGPGDQLSYIFTVGKFFNTDKLYFEDFQHFNTQPTNFLFSSYEHSFRLMPFYQYSTQNRFAEAHAEWLSRRLILKLLPLLKHSSVSEKMFVNYLISPEINDHIEVGYGINNIFLLLNIEAVAGFENGKFRSSAIKVSFNLNELGN
jgi:hypothetical protein